MDNDTNGMSGAGFVATEKGKDVTLKATLVPGKLTSKKGEIFDVLKLVPASGEPAWDRAIKVGEHTFNGRSVLYFKQDAPASF